MSFRLPLLALLVLLPATAIATAQGPPARPVYQPPGEELPSEDLPLPEELPAPTAEGPLMVEPAREIIGEPPALLGVHVVPLTADLLRFYGPELRSGVVIDSISQGTPADIYRLPIGGAIVAVDNRRITEPAELAAVIGMYAPGDFVSIVYHDGSQFTERRVRLAPRGLVLAEPAAPPLGGPREDPPLVLTPSENTEGELLPALPPAELQEDLILSNEDVQFILQRIEDLRQRSAEIEDEIQSLETILRSQER